MAVSGSSLPPAESIPQLSRDDQVRVLDLLFEPCKHLHDLSLDSLRTTRFLSYTALTASVSTQLNELADSADPAKLSNLDAILGAHPRLGEKKVDSAQSQSEQAHLKAGGAEEAEKLAALNAAYEEAFPGLRYVVFVNGRPRSEIMQDMQMRIDRKDLNLERRESIQAMCEIAMDRAGKLLG